MQKGALNNMSAAIVKVKEGILDAGCFLARQPAMQASTGLPAYG
jgi:hypothetical protein